MIAGFRGAVGFLTRIPVSGLPDIGPAVPWFPLVGGLVGAAGAGVYAVGLEILTPTVAASLAVGTQILLTGALHEDGLADVADAGGGSSPEDRRRILRDPSHGTFGVVALVVTLVVRVAALAGLDAGQAWAALTAATALARGGAVAMMAAGGPAFGDGLAARHMRALRVGPATAGVVSAVAIATVAVGVWALPATALAGLITTVLARWARRRLGGLNGDVLGAAAVLIEVAVLVVAGAAAAGDGPALIWWRG